MSTPVDIFEKIALLLTEEGLITPGECVKFLDFIKAEILS